MSRRRVFVTGLGMVSPHGEDPDAAFDRIVRGESAIRKVRSGPPEMEADVLLAAADFDPDGVIPRGRRMFMARAGEMAVVAARHALASAGLASQTAEVGAAGVYLGCGLGGAETLEDAYRVYFVRKRRRGRPTTVPLVMGNGPAAHISMELGVHGPTVTYSIACASSAVAIGEGFRALRDGYLDRALAGGAEAQLNDGSLAAWESLGALATEHRDGPEGSSRPFDAERSGFVLGEGAAILVLETEEAMRARGGRPYAEVLGYGAASDAHSLTEPHPDGQIRAMRAALADARLEPGAIGHVNAHATGTLAGDRVEVMALKEVFGAHAPALAVSATKSMHGHLVGAAGALEALLTVMALSRRLVPPTANLTHPDPACDLDFVRGVGRDLPDLRYALSNSFAFGGSNAALVFGRAGDPGE